MNQEMKSFIPLWRSRAIDNLVGEIWFLCESVIVLITQYKCVRIWGSYFGPVGYFFEGQFCSCISALSRSFLTGNNSTFSVITYSVHWSRLSRQIKLWRNSNIWMKIKWNSQVDHVLSQHTQKAAQQKEPFYSGKTDDSCNVGSECKNHKISWPYWIRMNI